MAIRVKCKCGKSLKVSSKHADKKLACPGCRRPFRIPASKFAAAAAKQSSAKSGAPAPRTAVAASGAAAKSAAPLPASLDDELASLGSGLIGFSQSDVLTELAGDAAHAASESAPVPVVVKTAAPVDVGYAADQRAAAAERRLSDPVSGPTRGFWADAFISFVYPVKSSSNVIMFMMISVVGLLEHLIAMVAGCFLLIVVLAIKGWFASLYFSVIQDTAAGSEDLPGFRVEGGLFESIIRPAFRFVCAGGIVLIPCMVLGALAAFRITPPSINSLMPLWFLGGIFLAPISFLLFALESASAIFRIDLILTTIARTILPYLAIWLMLAIVMIAMIVVGAGGGFLIELLFPGGFLAKSIADFVASTVAGIAISLFGIYLMLVAMRIIGLYYLHFKKRFAFELE